MKYIVIRGSLVQRARLDPRKPPAWVAVCDHLEVSVPGDSPDGAVMQLDKSLYPFFKTVLERGLFDEMVEKHKDAFALPNNMAEQSGHYIITGNTFILVHGVDIRQNSTTKVATA